MANFQQSLRPSSPSCLCPQVPPPSELVQGVAMRTTAVMPFHSLVQTTVFPSPLRALVSRQYGNKHHHQPEKRKLHPGEAQTKTEHVMMVLRHGGAREEAPVFVLARSCSYTSNLRSRPQNSTFKMENRTPLKTPAQVSRIGMARRAEWSRKAT